MICTVCLKPLKAEYGDLLMNKPSDEFIKELQDEHKECFKILLDKQTTT